MLQEGKSLISYTKENEEKLINKLEMQLKSMVDISLEDDLKKRIEENKKSPLVILIGIICILLGVCGFSFNSAFISFTYQKTTKKIN